jgi:hemerythrin-like domain-containing protein
MPKVSDLIPDALRKEDDAISMLEADHDKVIELFGRFDEIKESRANKEKEAIVAEACRELTIHTAIEEQIFYPAMRGPIADDDMMNEAAVEHEGAKSLIHELEDMDASDDMFNAKFSVLSEYVKHHIKEERNEMFSKARGTDIDMVALGRKMLGLRQELLKRPHDASPRPTPAKRRPQARKREPRVAR